MSISSALQSAQQKVANAYTAILNKGGTLPATQDLSNMPNAINTISTVNNNTLTVTPTTSQQTFNVSGGYTGYNPVTVNAVTASIDSNIQPSNIKKDVVILGTTGTYEGNTNIYPPDVNYIIRTDGTTEPITKGNNTLSYTETTIGNWNFNSAYANDTTILGLILNSITTINTQYLQSPYALSGFCYNATNLKYVYLKNLQTITGEGSSAGGQLRNAFEKTNIEEISFDSLSSINVTRSSAYIFQYMVQDCTKIKNIYFKALNSSSFGSYTIQFNNMLYRVTGCTVHFPSNLQSVIGSWTSVTAGFGGTNTTVLFDLPATT